MAGLASELKQLEYGRGIGSALTELANTLLRIRQAQYNRAQTERFVGQMTQQLQQARSMGLPETQAGEISSALNILQSEMASPTATSPLALIPGGPGAPSPYEAMSKISTALTSAMATQKLIQGLMLSAAGLGRMDEPEMKEVFGKYSKILGMQSFNAALGSTLRLLETYRELGLEPPKGLVETLMKMSEDIDKRAGELAKVQEAGELRLAAIRAARTAGAGGVSKEDREREKQARAEIDRAQNYIRQLNQDISNILASPGEMKATGATEKDIKQKELDNASVLLNKYSEMVNTMKRIAEINEEMGWRWGRAQAAPAINRIIEQNLAEFRKLQNEPEWSQHPGLATGIRGFEQLKKEIGEWTAGEAGSREQVVGSREQEVGSVEEEVGSETPAPRLQTPQEVGSREQGVGSREQEVSGREQGKRLNLEQEVLDILSKSRMKK